MGRHRRRFSPEFSVTQWSGSGPPVWPISQVARELGCGESSLSNWITKDRATRALAHPKKFSADTAESDELRRLRRKVAELELEREILKRSMVFWVKESNG